MKHAGVIGYPLGHSLSPAIFKTAFDAAGIEARYQAWETPPEELEARMNALRGDEMLGANVTIPHKEAVVPLLDRVEERAERIGAVNTIANAGGRLVGYNTDVAGFVRALREDAGFDPKGKRTAVLGAGGAARAVALALIEGGASMIVVTGPIPEQVDKLVADLRGLTASGTIITWCHWQDGTFMTVLPQADLLVNCTPVGMHGSETEGQSPVAADYLPASGVVFDLVYNPPETPLLNAAKGHGAKAVSGLGMLVYQAAESFRLWTGQEAPVERMLEAGRQALAAAASGRTA
jgi:shikimate dehydrogenase